MYVPMLFMFISTIYFHNMMKTIKTLLLIALLAINLPVGAQAVMQIEHPWQGKRVAYFGDSITDPRNSGSKTKWWQWLQTWLGIQP